MSERCDQCKFWQDQNIIGLCRRFPVYANKHRNEWCGEWAQKPVLVLPVVEMPEEKPKRKYTRRQNVETSA